ncbi:MAG: sugar-binding protein, partial [Saprospiraceae bacterium]|nr:sugar-binding protein [Saprospiraceae bacterium]
IASYLSTKPIIDGDWNDLVNKEYPAEIVVYGSTTWKGRDDLGASFRIAWDAINLYIADKVRDDQYVQNATGEDIFKGDSIEILLDTKIADDYYYTKLSPDDFQLGITPGRPNTIGTKEAYLWLPTNIAGARSQVNIAAIRNETEGITRIEAAIPWSIFEITPEAGTHFGFALSVSDNDLSSQNVQQKMVSNVKTRVLTDPTTWGDLTLGN